MKRMLLLICLLFPALLMGQYGHGGYGIGKSNVPVTIYGKKTTGNLFQVINDNDLSVGDSSIVVSSKGYIGIGTNNPTEELTVATSGGSTRIMATDGTVQSVIQAASSTGWFGTLTGHAFNIGSASTTRMSIGTDGTIGIGTTSPQFKIGIVDATPILNLTDSDINKITNSTAQMSDSQAVKIDASLAQPQIVIKQSLGYNQRVQYALEGWVTHDNDTVTIGVLPANAIVTNVNLWTQEAFNSDGTDEVCCGFTGTAEAYAVDVDVSDTGVETWSVGSVAKTVDATSRTVVVYYHSSDETNLTTGECHVLVEWYQATVNP